MKMKTQQYFLQQNKHLEEEIFSKNKCFICKSQSLIQGFESILSLINYSGILNALNNSLNIFVFLP